MNHDEPKVPEFAANHLIKGLIGLAKFDNWYEMNNISINSGGISNQKFDERLDKIIEKMGGVPEFFIVKEGVSEKKLFDSYPESAMNELVQYFRRAKRSVSRAAMTMVALQEINNNIEALVFPAEGGVRSSIVSLAETSFWEDAEVAFIRLTSYWDRVGQVLAFAFFHIRQYERDGFASVVQKIHQNVRPVDMELLAKPAWNELWAFVRSDKEDGYKWLSSRRNALVHSLYLRPIVDMEDNEHYETMFDNIDEAVRNKLKPGSPQQEVQLMVAHLKRAAELFPAVLEVVERAAETRHKSRVF